APMSKHDPTAHDVAVTDLPPTQPGAAAPVSIDPVALAPPGFPLLRGIRWGTDPAILLLHAPGGDLDDWRDLPPRLAHRTESGTVALDLPGHGLSDESPDHDDDPERLVDLLKSVIATTDCTGVRAVVAAGATATALLRVVADVHLSGIVCLSPELPQPEARPLPRSPRVPKLLLVRGGESDELPRARQLAAEVGGWTIVSGVTGAGPNGMPPDGPRGDQVHDQIAGFLFECLLRR
ncbi:MAG TPA: alpha/beta fold hydrolase, partial [Thermomicrobiales bacterium]|nr:alpha/beta fold hydrolase [Thermomicrobiales bacterium]